MEQYDPNYFKLPTGANIDPTPMTNSMTPGQAPWMRLLSDPNFIALLGGAAQKLDPQGVGGALGGAAADYQKTNSAQAMATMLAARSTPPTKLALTPAGVPGPTSETTTRNADGTFSTTIKGDSPATSSSIEVSPGQTISTPGNTTMPAGRVAPAGVGTSMPISSSISAAPQAESRTRMSELPFLLAPTQGMLDFRGLSAEQVPGFLQAFYEGEKLRQANVGQILSAYDQESIRDAREAASAVNRETAAQMRRLAPFDIPKVEAEIRKLQNFGDVSELEANKLRETASLNLDTAKAELASRLATVNAQNAAAGASAASAARSTQLMQQEGELFDINRPAAKAAAALYKEKDPVTGQEYTIPGSAIPQYLQSRQTALATARERGLAYTERMSALSEAKQKTEADRAQLAVTAEITLIQPKDNKGRDIDAKAVAPEADVFNLHSTKPYVYIYFPEEPGWDRHPNYSDKNVPVPIPQLDRSTFPEMPRNAREVYALATSMGVTVRRVIEMMYERGLKEKAPWLQ